MKNKKVTYLLGVLVLVVWGVIIYRVFQSAGPGEDDLQPANHPMVKEPYNDYTMAKDTGHLQLNYKDPFLTQKQKDTLEHPVKKSAEKAVPIKPLPAMNWNFIKYSGYIHNPGSKNLVALLTINGKSVMMSEGETTEQVKLVKNLKDSIQIAFNGKTTYIKMRSGTL